MTYDFEYIRVVLRRAQKACGRESFMNVMSCKVCICSANDLPSFKYVPNALRAQHNSTGVGDDSERAKEIILEVADNPVGEQQEQRAIEPPPLSLGSDLVRYHPTDLGRPMCRLIRHHHPTVHMPSVAAV